MAGRRHCLHPNALGPPPLTRTVSPAMHAPDSNSVLKTLREATDLTRRVGAKAEAATLEELQKTFLAEMPTLKVLRGAVDSAMSQAAQKIGAILLDERREPTPGME